MATLTDQAVIIRLWDFSETSQTVSLFGRELGVIRGLAKGAKRDKGNFSGGLDVLTRGQVMAIVKPDRGLANITAWHLQDPYPALRRNLAANRAAQYMVDLIHHMLVEHDPHPTLFDGFARSLGALNGAIPADFTLLQFQWFLLNETGYRPALSRDALTGASLREQGSVLSFSPAVGGVIAQANRRELAIAPGKGRTPFGPVWRVRRETIDLLRRLDDLKICELAEDDPASLLPTTTGSLDFESRNMHGLSAVRRRLPTESREPRAENPLFMCLASQQTVDRANRLLAAYFREIIGSEPPAMRWAFSDLTT